MTLLEKALAAHKPTRQSGEFVRDELDLVKAYLRGQITIRDMTTAIEKRTLPYTLIARACKHMADRGELIIKE